MAFAALNSGLLSPPRSPPNSAILTADNYNSGSDTHSLIDHCTNLNHLKQLHAHILRSGLFFNPFSASKLFKVSALSPFSSLDYALKVFDQIPQPNVFAWNTLIRAFASSSDPIQSLFVFNRMLHESEEFPNNFTFPFVVKAASAISSLALCQSIHGMVIKSSLGFDLYILNSLIYCYASCGDLDSAYLVFSKIDEKDVVSWNSMIAGFAQGGFPQEALALYERMDLENVSPNDVTMVGVLTACTKELDLEFGRRICEFIERNGMNSSLTVSNAMLDMYVKNGSVEDARRLFDRMEKKDKFSWTTMIDGYAKSGNFDAARSVFDAMPEQEISAWNVLISAYEQDGNPKEALVVFHELQRSRNAKPDEVTLVSVLSACAQLGAVDIGSWIHVYITKQNIKLNCHLVTSLIDMYSKCGDIEKALEVFYSAERRDVFVWSAMIAGLAMHGRGRASIDLFMEMVEAQVKPNSITFTNLLCACSHTGLVDEGRMFFNQMESVYGVVPGSKHYACMVDILGRAGFLDDAVELIEKMPIAPTPSVWGALLGACRIHGNVKLAEMASSHLLEIDPDNDGAYVLLSNIYAKTGNWENVSELRQHMKDFGIKKEPGCSSIEVDGVIHEFLVGDNSHPLSSKIYRKLNEIVATLKSVGYVPNESHLLQYVEEQHMKVRALNLHSEKLAIAFGLISTSPSQPIRIVKNLRVCGDCHSVAKLVSKLYNRDILLRDRYRFHHFSNGECSCMDYW